VRPSPPCSTAEPRPILELLEFAEPALAPAPEASRQSLAGACSGRAGAYKWFATTSIALTRSIA
jgi:hypothetical protein